MSLLLTPLTKAAPDDVEALLDAAFGTDRRGRTAYRLRHGASPIARLSFAAWDGERLVGTLQSWPVALRHDGSTDMLVMVGPVAVAPDRQGQGLGHQLMAAVLAASTPDDALMMIGDPDYYQRFGFTAAMTGGWHIAGPYESHRLLARLQRPVPSEGELQPVSFASA